MFDESILELEEIEFGENRWHPLVIEACYKNLWVIVQATWV